MYKVCIMPVQTNRYFLYEPGKLRPSANLFIHLLPTTPSTTSTTPCQWSKSILWRTAKMAWVKYHYNFSQCDRPRRFKGNRKQTGMIGHAPAVVFQDQLAAQTSWFSQWYMEKIHLSQLAPTGSPLSPVRHAVADKWSAEKAGLCPIRRTLPSWISVTALSAAQLWCLGQGLSISFDRLWVVHLGGRVLRGLVCRDDQKRTTLPYPYVNPLLWCIPIGEWTMTLKNCTSVGFYPFEVFFFLFFFFSFSLVLPFYRSTSISLRV